jgi:hypothetical protein
MTEVPSIMASSMNTRSESKSFRGGAPEAAVTPVPSDRLLAVAAGRDVPSEVHPEVLEAPPVLEIDRFNLWYGSKQALHGITMPIPNNKVTALIGPAVVASRRCCGA